jgi:diguanylate cyclase (GGDEF)-like protein/PAS domain S-box-containing protein
MRIDKDKSMSSAAEIRRRAEEQLKAKTSEAGFSRTDDETQRLLHELQVHRIELEMQNEELRQARAEVETALDRYTDLYDLAPVGYMTLDRNGAISAVNLSGASLLGGERSRLIGRRFGQFVAASDRPAFSAFLGTIVTSRNKVQCEVALLNKGDLPLIVQIEAMAAASGQGCRLALIDITGRRQAEEAMRESEERMYRLAEMAVDTIIMLDDSGTVMFCNAATERMFGYSAAEITGRDFHSFFIPEQLRTESKQGFDSFKEHGTGALIGRTTEVAALRKDGTEFPLELSISALNLKGKWNAIGIMRDITARKQLDAEIQDAREYAENIVETVREPLVVLNSDLKVLTANHSFYDTFKVSPEETIGNFIYDLGNRQWDIPKLRVLVEEILPLETVFNGYEVEHDFPGIGRKTILLNARQISRENICSHIILLAMEDITARKQLETEIQLALEYAENIVETVREPLVVLNSDLKILTANHSFYETFKVSPKETIGNFIYDLGNRQWDIPRLRVLIEEILPHDTVINGYEVEHDFPGIGRKIMLLNARQIFREDIGSHIILLAMEDITERKLTEERISEVIRQQQAILDNIPNIAWLKDREGIFVAVNDPFSKSFGLAPKDLVGKSVHDIYPPDLAVKYDNEFREVMTSGTRTYFEESIVDGEGKIRHVEKTETPIFNDTGAVIGIIGIAHDFTSRKEVEVSLRYDCAHDILTGLYNRTFFDEELERLAHGRMFPLSIVMADINGLKTANDTLGHDAGDDLIRLSARIILEAFRAEDIVARIGGDEFAVLLPETASTVAEEAVERIMSCPEIINGQVSIAFGIASAENKDQLAEALKLSDERMYRHKSAQKES